MALHATLDLARPPLAKLTEMIQWTPASGPTTRQAPHDVHIWLSPNTVTSAQLVHWESLLSASELEEISARRFRSNRQVHLMGRALRREILSHYANIPARLLAFIQNSAGKPSLYATHGKPPLHFSQSYTADSTVIAIAKEGPLGIDLESWTGHEDVEGVARTIFSTAEQAEWHALPGADKLEGFFNAWTRKEAYLKALGTGFSRPPQSFSVQLSPHLPPRLLHCEHDPAASHIWHLTSWQMESRQTLALATPFRPSRINHFTYSPG